MRPLREIPREACRDLQWFFTDIDDTMTSAGILPDSAYTALWDLHRAGIRVVPVTGRPAGWCDHIARMWPVAAVVGENGAFTYSYDRARRRMDRRFTVAPDRMKSNHRRLASAARRVLAEVPGTALAADQPFRVSDWAIDFREDVPPLPDSAVEAICAVLQGEGVHYKVSSIHVNFWVGDFDKMSASAGLLENATGEKFPTLADRVAFIGDSPNDEPLFAGFPLSIAVGNLRAFADRLARLPRYITEGDSAAGFCEAVETILALRRGNPPGCTPSPASPA